MISYVCLCLKNDKTYIILQELGLTVSAKNTTPQHTGSMSWYPGGHSSMHSINSTR